jgi:hypothetical protein
MFSFEGRNFHPRNQKGLNLQSGLSVCFLYSSFLAQKMSERGWRTRRAGYPSRSETSLFNEDGTCIDDADTNEHKKGTPIRGMSRLRSNRTYFLERICERNLQGLHPKPSKKYITALARLPRVQDVRIRSDLCLCRLTIPVVFLSPFRQTPL